jgi:hypothetical protein
LTGKLGEIWGNVVFEEMIIVKALEKHLFTALGQNMTDLTTQN